MGRPDAAFAVLAIAAGSPQPPDAGEHQMSKFTRKLYSQDPSAAEAYHRQYRFERELTSIATRHLGLLHAKKPATCVPKLWQSRLPRSLHAPWAIRLTRNNTALPKWAAPAFTVKVTRFTIQLERAHTMKVHDVLAEPIGAMLAHRSWRLMENNDSELTMA